MRKNHIFLDELEQIQYLEKEGIQRRHMAGEELDKYKHELATLKSLRNQIVDCMDARIEIVEQKIAECMAMIEMMEKYKD